MIARGMLFGLLAAAGTAAAAPAPSGHTEGHTERVEYRNPSSAPSRGPATALVTIEVFFVPGPSMPSVALHLLQQLQERHPARVRLIYRILMSGSALLVPSAALEAHTEGKFFELMAELGKQRGVLKKEDLLEIARKVGVDPQRVALAPKFYGDVLDDNQHRFERLHGTTIPSALFNARPTRVGLGGINAADLDREYEEAYGRALDKLDRGFAPGELAAAFDDEAIHQAQPIVMSIGTPDDDSDRSPLDHPLASPPLQLDRLPSFGKPGVAAPVPIVVLCRPNDMSSCNNLLRVIEPEVRIYPDQVRVVWAPWFDVSRDDAAELTLLGDAALCAESVSSYQGELTTSPGWVWIKEMYTQVARVHGKKPPADKLIDAVAAKLDVDLRALSACRARIASATLAWIAEARRSGVPRTASAVVIGGRIYSGLTDQMLIQELVEAELAPGVLGSLPRWHR